MLEQAVECHRGGDKSAARKALDKALALSPDHPDALHMLANLDGEAGEFVRAEERVRKALELRPGFPAFLATLSRILAAQGQMSEAISCLQEAIRKEPGSERFNSLGLLQLNAGQFAQATEAFERALELDPANVAARVNLGVTRFTAGLPREAAGHLEQALAQVPEAAEIAQRLGLAWQACGEHDQAVGAFQRALQSQPDSLALMTSLAISFTALGNFEAALAQFDEVLRRDPANPDALAGKAELLEWQGEYQAGQALLQPALAAAAEEPALLAVYARLLRRTGEAQKGIDLLGPLLEQGRLQGPQLRQVRFTLGDLHDQLGRYDEAFSHYAAAHEYSPNSFSARAHQHFIDNLKLRFDRDNVQRMNRAEFETDQPVFIVGMPRSGTSLAEQILAAHPGVYAVGERPHIGHIVSELAPEPNPASTVLGQHARAYLSELGEQSAGAQRVTDKMPLNFLYLGWIAQLFPRARVVWCRRDLRDTGLSCYATNFIDPALAFSERLEDIGHYGRASEDLMRHWQDVLDLPIYELCYEDLVEQPESGVRALLAALELDWEPACMAFHEQKRVVNTSSHAQVREPFYTRSVGRWRHYERQLAPLINVLEQDG